MMKNATVVPKPAKEVTLAGDKEPGLSLSGIQSQVKFLSGSILTIIDASISDPVQREAMKSLIKGEVRSSLDNFGRLCQSWLVRYNHEGVCNNCPCDGCKHCVKSAG